MHRAAVRRRAGAYSSHPQWVPALRPGHEGGMSVDVNGRPRQSSAKAKQQYGGRPMLRAEDNKFLTESGAGTGMGELLRRFWIPVLLSAELPDADGTPKKIVVMGEELLAFRDTRGVVGVIDQYCP